jgi:hypothetical protein
MIQADKLARLLLLPAFAAALVTSCESATYSDCAIACARDLRCPEGFECSNGYCTRARACPPTNVDLNPNLADGGHGGVRGHAEVNDAGSPASVGPPAEAGSGEVASNGGAPPGPDGADGGIAGSGGATDVATTSGAGGNAEPGLAAGGVGGPDPNNESGGEAGQGGAGEPPSSTPSRPRPAIADITNKVDPEVAVPVFTTWDYPIVANTVPTIVGRSESAALTVYFLAATNQIGFADLTDPGPSDHWDEVPGGWLASDPTAIVLPFGDVELHALGHDERPWSITRVGQTWSSWSSEDVLLRDSPVTVLSNAGLLHAARRVDNVVCFKRSAGGWRDSRLESTFQPAIATIGDGTAVPAVLAAVSLDGTLQTAEWPNDGEEVQWNALGGIELDSPPVILEGDRGRLDAVVRGKDASFYWQSFAPGASGKWTKISGPFVSYPMAVADSAQGFLVFGKDASGVPWVRRKVGDKWSAWMALDAELSPVTDERFPGAAIHLDEITTIMIVLRTQNGTLRGMSASSE